MLKPRMALAVIVILVVLSSCGRFFRGVGSNISKGVEIDSLVSSLTLALERDSNRNRILALRDSLVMTADSSINQLLSDLEFDTISDKLAKALEESLADSTLQDSLLLTLTELGNKFTPLLMDTVLGQLNSPETQVQLIAFRDGLLNQETSDRLAGTLQAVLDSLSLDSITTQLLAGFTGEEAKQKIAGLVDSVMKVVVNHLDEGIAPKIEQQVGVIQKYAKELILLLALLAAGIVGFVWWQRRRYYRLIGLITGKIFEIPNQQLYDQLTDQIRSKAIEHGLEGPLREILQENGLTGDVAWKNYNAKQKSKR